jgi:hypothetical protein
MNVEINKVNNGFTVRDEDSMFRDDSEDPKFVYVYEFKEDDASSQADALEAALGKASILLQMERPKKNDNRKE